MDTAHRPNINHRLSRQPHPVIADGGIGSMLLGRLPQNHPAWSAKFPCCEILNRAAAEIVCHVHTEYVKAGAEILTTNTFCGSPVMLGRFGLEAEAMDLNTRAVDLARQAISMGTSQREVFIAGSVGPIVIGDRSFTDQELAETYAVQIRALVDAGVDLLLIETVVSHRQLCAALAAVPPAMQLPVWVSLAPQAERLLPVDGTIEQVIATGARFGVSLFGANCGEGPRSLESTLRQLATIVKGPLYLAPSAGLPDTGVNPARYPYGPESFFEEVRSLLESYDILVLGGCCGTTPEHIAHLRAATVDAID